MIPSASVSNRSALPYVLPFAAFLLLLAVQEPLAAAVGRGEPLLRVVVLTGVLWAVSRPVLDLRIRHAASSLLLGLAVFAIWVGPDLLVPGYRHHWLFENQIMGRLGTSSLDASLRADPLSLLLRSVRAVILVPIIEELFWRAWLMRWLIDKDFSAVRLGTYVPLAFWLTAVLFASEHGPFWEVGLLAGVAYNWWMVRTRSLGDCVLAHATTNAALSTYVLLTGQWQYWS